MSRVRIFDLKYSEAEVESFLQDCRKILHTGHLTNHDFVKKFEQQFSLVSGLPYNVAVTNGSSALHTLFLLEDFRGKEVILPTNTFIGDWLAIQQAGAIPILVDIDPVYLGPSLHSVMAAISPRTKAILTTHIGGIISPEIRNLQIICRESGIYLFEDCAHALGSTFQGVRAGAFGDAAAFSFHLTKVATAGEGGMVSLAKEEWMKAASSVRQFGKSEDPHVFDRIGWNLKMTEFQAALGCLDLDRFPERLKKRQILAGIYQRRLQGSAWKMFLPPQLGECAYYKVILCSPVERAGLKRQLEEKEISLTNGVYFTPLHCQPVVKAEGLFPQADLFARQHICPPCYPELSEVDVHRVCDELLRIAS